MTLLAPVYDLHTAASLGLLGKDNKCKVLGARVVMRQDEYSSGSEEV
ncbi:MAG: hypothetical protein KTR33_06500 [Gammaproteobacteria bacterium]|nr:hypothetical protein [Gammaproteobacteria bacterium]